MKSPAHLPSAQIHESPGTPPLWRHATSSNTSFRRKTLTEASGPGSPAPLLGLRSFLPDEQSPLALISPSVLGPGVPDVEDFVQEINLRFIRTRLT